MGETPTTEEVDLEFVVKKESYRSEKGGKVTLAHYVYVDLIAFGHREVSFVIALAEDQATNPVEMSGVVIDITTAAQRKAFGNQLAEFSKTLNMREVVAKGFAIEGLPAINDTFKDYSNLIIGLESMYRIVLDLKLHDRLVACADTIEKYLGEFVRFEATDAPIAPAPQVPTTSLYSERYNEWGSW